MTTCDKVTYRTQLSAEFDHESGEGGQMATDRPASTADAIAVAQIETAWDAVGRAASRSRAHDRLLARAGVNLDRAGWTLLRQLDASNCELRVTDLADLLDIDPPSVTRKVQQLEQAGLVTRSLDNDDRRASRLALTTHGHETLEHLLHARRDQLAETLAAWDDRQLATFARLLRQFAKDIAAAPQHLTSGP
jgi:DNA-binding MarR family transcriptional regulator